MDREKTTHLKLRMTTTMMNFSDMKRQGILGTLIGALWTWDISDMGMEFSWKSLMQDLTGSSHD
jgi:hypothetical protein